MANKKKKLHFKNSGYLLLFTLLICHLKKKIKIDEHKNPDFQDI